MSITTLVIPPPFQDFGTDFYPSFPSSAISEADFSGSGDIDNYRGVDPLAVDKEARSILISIWGTYTALRLLSGSHPGQAPG